MFLSVKSQIFAINILMVNDCDYFTFPLNDIVFVNILVPK